MLEVLRSGQAVAGSAAARVRATRSPPDSGVPHASAVSSGTTGLHLALRAVGVSDGAEVITSPFSFVASANVAVYERARPVFADIDPVTLNLSVEAAARRSPRGRRRCCPSTCSATRPTSPASSGSGCRSSRTPARPSVPSTATACPVGGRGHPAVFGFYANKQLTTGEGGMITRGRRGAQGADRLRAQPGPRTRHGLARPRSTRLQLPPDRHRLRAGAGPARAPGRDARRPRPGGRRCTGRRWARSRVSSFRVRTSGGERRGWFVFVVQLPRELDRDEVVRSLGDRGIPSKPYFPAVHLMSYYRDTFGHRPGEFPVCEDVAARSIALPFFPEMSEGQVDQVAGARLRRRSWGHPARCRASQSPRIRASARSTTRSGSTGAWVRTTSRSRAPTRTMLAAQGIISDEDLEALQGALGQVERELGDGTFPFADGDEDIHMAIERRVTEIAGAGRVAGCTPPARATTRWPPTWPCSCGRTPSGP